MQSLSWNLFFFTCTALLYIEQFLKTWCLTYLIQIQNPMASQLIISSKLYSVLIIMDPLRCSYDCEDIHI